MPSWSEVMAHVRDHPNTNKQAILHEMLFQCLWEISENREHKNVILYASAFMQKPRAPGLSLVITDEDMNGFMNAMKGMDCTKGISLILHTPGGVTNAVKSIVDYLHQKFLKEEIEVIVPRMAMSGGSMISLASDKIIMGKPSNLGPIDAQLTSGNKNYSAREIRETFLKAKRDIEENVNLAYLWQPLLSAMGPALLATAENALSYGKELVTKWLLARRLLPKTIKNRKEKALEIAQYFNADSAEKRIHNHGQVICIPDMQELGIPVKCLENNQDLQESVMTLYHIMTILFETSSATKFIAANGHDKKSPQIWIKSTQA